MDFNKEVVHIGCFSHMPGNNSGPKIEPGTHYTCFELIDHFKEFIDKTYDELPQLAKDQVTLIFSHPSNNYRNGRSTGLESDSIDEVHMYNVLGDPKIENLDDFFVESRRILKLGKSFYIGETNTPYSFENLILRVRKHQFALKVLVPHINEYVSGEEMKRFHEIFLENTSSEKYSKNFNEWYGLLEKMHLIHRYKLTDSEKETIAKYQGEHRPYSLGSFMIELIKP